MNGNFVHPVVTLAWSNKTGTDQAPTTDTVVDMTEVDDFEIQVDSTAAGNLANDIDINVLRCVDIVGVASPTWDTTSTQLLAGHADTLIKTYHITTPVGGWMKFRLDNNSGASAAYVTARILKRSRRAE